MTIPAGLIDNNVEMFKNESDLHATQSGCVVKGLNISEKAKSILLLHYRQNFYAKELYLSWGIKTEENQLLQYAECLFSGFDNVPDIEITTGKVNPEIWNCPKKTTCKGYGKVCKSNGLTNKETEVAKAIATGEPDKAIHEALSISLNTFKDYKKSIYKKLNCHSKVELVNALQIINI